MALRLKPGEPAWVRHAALETVMKPKPFPLGILSLVLATSACGSADQVATDTARPTRPSSGFEVGEPFPTLALPALEDGRPRSIVDFRGKKLILHIFASW